MRSAWVIHAFQKKSKAGIKCSRAEIDLVRMRLGTTEERAAVMKESKFDLVDWERERLPRFRHPHADLR